MGYGFFRFFRFVEVFSLRPKNQVDVGYVLGGFSKIKLCLAMLFLGIFKN